MKIEQVLKITFSLIFAITAFCPTAFSRQGTLTGQVVDGFDNVVKDVEVKIKKLILLLRLMKTVNTGLILIPVK